MKRKIAIAIPTRDNVAIETTFSLANMVADFTYKFCARGEADLSFVTCAGTLLPQMRNTLVEESIKIGATHILWVDSDMRFPKDALERLLKHNAPVVGANYPQRKSPVKPTAANLKDLWIYEEGQTGLEPVKFLGHGLCLVETVVYDALEKPWYMLAWSQKKECIVGEDVFFLGEVRKRLECPVMLDHDLSREVSHIGFHEYTWKDAFDDFEAVKAIQTEAGDGA